MKTKLSKYIINPDTLELERVERSIMAWIGRTGAVLLIGIAAGIGFFFLFHCFLSIYFINSSAVGLSSFHRISKPTTSCPFNFIQ